MAALLNVLIYSGAGTCDFSVKQTLKTLKKCLNHSYDVKLVSSDILRNEMIPWDENCALFVVPGGRDLHYQRDFDGKVVERLKKQVEGGRMSYLGICAGAYFASDRIEFAKGHLYEIIQDRPLKLIKCVAIGPIGKFFYSDDPKASESEIKESLQAVNVKVDSDSAAFKMAYNGGCYFESVGSAAILATYSSNGHPAIITRGNVCLSGVHLEYDAMDCLRENGSGSVFSELLKYEMQRASLVERILKDLGLIVNESRENEVGIDKVEIYTNISGLSASSSDTRIVDAPPPPPEYLNIPNLLYSRVTTSTQTILQSAPNLLDILPNFSLYVADHQINGKGRSDNFWISSPSCLQFTLKVEQLFGKASQLPLIQFLMALSVTEAINSSQPAGSKIVARIKWPNDVYLYGSGGPECIGKVSGILVNCIQSHYKKVFHVLVGVGINLLSDPSLPNIVHLNDHLSVKLEKGPFLMDLLERFKLYHERLVNLDEFPFENYHSSWLHTGQVIRSRDFPGKLLKIKGIDQFGYLIAEEVGTRQVFKFEPDGNSFDMMGNLIHRK